MDEVKDRGYLICGVSETRIGFANIDDRSIMNVTFNLVDESKKEVFDKLSQESNISGINGHRSVGGYRASIYNAMPYESIEVLVQLMKKFENIV